MYNCSSLAPSPPPTRADCGVLLFSSLDCSRSRVSLGMLGRPRPELSRDTLAGLAPAGRRKAGGLGDIACSRLGRRGLPGCKPRGTPKAALPDVQAHAQQPGAPDLGVTPLFPCGVSGRPPRGVPLPLPPPPKLSARATAPAGGTARRALARGVSPEAAVAGCAEGRYARIICPSEVEEGLLAPLLPMACRDSCARSCSSSACGGARRGGGTG